MSKAAVLVFVSLAGLLIAPPTSALGHAKRLPRARSGVAAVRAPNVRIHKPSGPAHIRAAGWGRQALVYRAADRLLSMPHLR